MKAQSSKARPVDGTNRGAITARKLATARASTNKSRPRACPLPLVAVSGILQTQLRGLLRSTLVVGLGPHFMSHYSVYYAHALGSIAPSAARKFRGARWALSTSHPPRTIMGGSS